MDERKACVWSGILKIAGKANNMLLDLLFPEGVTCLCCGCAPAKELENGLCESCVKSLEAQQIRQEAQNDRECPDELAFVRAAFTYEEPASKLITMLKYRQIRSAAQPLIDAMLLLPSGEEEIIVPVPTTKKRLKERGFNQAQLLAQGIGRRLGMQVCDVLVREGEQKEQAGMNGEERLLNVAGCMRAKERLDGRRILLIDDVYTTGATAREAARALYEAGAASVGVFAAARALSAGKLPEFMKEDH